MNKCLLLLSVFISILHGDVIGDVEYQLPSSVANWKIAHNEKSKKLESIQYVNKTEDYWQTFVAIAQPRSFLSKTFSSSYFEKRSEEELIKSIIESLEVPEYNVVISHIERTPTTLFYEWSASQKKHVVIQGWKREFLNSKRFCSVSYTGGRVNSSIDLDELTAGWMEVIQQAKEKVAE